MRANAANWLELAEKVWHFRRDLLTAEERAELQANQGKVKALLRERADASRLKLAIESLESVLRRVGGQHYPKSSLVENVEFFLVAAIVILGLRAYVVQPFKIPTNSMWPSYNGLTGEVYATVGEEPGAAMRLVNYVLTGSKAKRVDAPVAGEVLIPLVGTEARAFAAFRSVPGKSWGVFPATLREYHLFVGERAVTVQVPGDFDFDWVLRDAFFPGDPRLFREIAAEEMKAGRYVDMNVKRPGGGGMERRRFLRTGKQVEAGQRLLSFDILTGDQLFVDRVSYHFVRPKVGDGFVFRTRSIPSLNEQSGDQYYIKRLVGGPGDVMEIREPGLWRNGEPITGSRAFVRNAARSHGFPGFLNEGMMLAGQELVVESGRYLALGDNSANSLDGRYWGTVPGRDVVGRPLWIYYPFTKRWGPAP